MAGINDPLACLIHLGGAAWFGWQAQQLVQRGGSTRRRWALSIFALTAVGVLAISATYHGAPIDHPWKAWLQRTDHAAIFLLIAGTLTSFHAVGLGGAGRLWMIGVVWVVAVGALTSKLAWWSVFGDGVGLSLYVGLGAVGTSSLAFLPRSLPWRAFVPFALGGAIYIAGALADLWVPRWLVGRVLGSHEIFHLAVVGALMMHWRFFHQWSPGQLAEERAVPRL